MYKALIYALFKRGHSGLFAIKTAERKAGHKLACWLVHKIENATGEDCFFICIFIFIFKLLVYWLKHIFEVLLEKHVSIL